MSYAEPLTGRIAHHGECPFWDDRAGRLLFADVLAGVILAVDTGGDFTRFDIPSDVVTAIRHRRTGGYVVATRNALLSADQDLKSFQSLVVISEDPNIRTNDGGCDPIGGFVIGTMADNERQDAGAVYRVTPELGVRTLLEPVSISNGVQWSADGKLAFYIDTPTRQIAKFDVDPDLGTWSNRRVHAQIDARYGFPDGMAIDQEDGLWVALWGGSAINHYDSRGRLLDTIRVEGATQVSSCAFGGQDRSVLYITTSRQGLSDSDEPLAGSIFQFQTATRGSVPHEFGG